MTEFTQSLCLDLTDTFTGDIELFADLFKGTALTVFQTEPERKDFRFTRSQRLEDSAELFFKQGMACSVDRRRSVIIGDKVTEVAVFFLTDRRFQRNRLLRYPQDFSYLIDRHIQFISDFLSTRFMAVSMEQLAGNLLDAVNGFNHMNRDTDSTRLVGNRTGNCLTNPPGCVGRELKALGMVELFDCLNQAEVTFLNQIEELHTTSDITFCNRNDQTQVCFTQTFSGLSRDLGVIAGHLFSEFIFLISSQQRNAADFLEVDLNRVIDIDTVAGIDDIRFDGCGVLQPDIKIIVDAQIVKDFDIAAFQRVIKFVKLFRVKIHLFKSIGNFLCSQFTFDFPLLHQFCYSRFFVSHLILSFGIL